jgi:type VI secretion system protein ImpA
MDLQGLLEPPVESPPPVTDLDAAGAIVTLDMLAKWGAPEQDPDWHELQAACLDALAKSRDLRPATYLTAALLHTEGVGGLADGLQLLRGLVERHWDELYPPLDDDGDATERANALFNLTNFHKVLKPLRLTPLVADPVAGRFALRDIEIAEGKAEVPEGFEGDPPQLGFVRAAFQATGQEALQALLATVERGLEDLAAIESRFCERGGVEQTPDLSRLKDGLQRIAVALHTYMPEDAVPDTRSQAATEPAPASDIATDRVPVQPTLNGEIRSRQEAVAAMEGIARYFRHHEPSSPVPLLMERAKRLVDMDFLSILRDVAPDAVAQGEKLRGDDKTE